MGFADMIAGVLNVVPNFINAGANVAGVINQKKTNDLNFKLQKEQYSYQKYLQKIWRNI